MDITKEQLGGAVKQLLAHDIYKELSPQIGGWYWTTETLWAAFQLVPSAPLPTLRALAETALKAPGAYAALLSDFLADLFDILAIIAADSGEIAQAAAEGAVDGAMLMPTVVAQASISVTQLALSGGRKRLSPSEIFTIATAAVMAGGMILPVVGGTAYLINIGVGAEMGAAERGGKTAAKVADKAAGSRTARNFGFP